MIQVSQVTKRYGGETVLHNVDFHLETGDFAMLQGRSGSGKSSLLKLLYREIDADEGTIRFRQIPIGQTLKHVLRREIGIVFQSFQLIEQKTVFENIALAGKAVGRPMAEIETEAMRLLDRVGLRNKKDAFPGTLSGGQQQRAAIVRALLNKPSLLLADEPTGNLDKETAADILQLLKELHEEEEMTMLIVTHDDLLLTQQQAKIWTVEDGKVHEQAIT
ncbi:ATP-binding cassette domain-containing protein [Microbacterium sp. APC 3898]|uniref:ATP-binding cassette domain-containing protein n=1 Tax=Planococcus notacanthi TaxID=3035188 RepID=A0ABT7ZH03_9BACL|nr:MULTISPECIES: ATP-binding cassette domain-containing protein [Terrabacteria group]MDN3426441.1 ATP-binding cassette domain-containing protein [Planococcus sp. APC 4016]MDN3438723.1 ATP-binding cassette domain-containing protein [Planococcus sp. APC 3900]MDN3498136.1 ATP-binding cassette domain-containing protein [Microbacterium sp. APC 3898]